MDKQKQQEYQKMVKRASPNSPIFADCLRAFLVGGIICTIGQCIMNFCLSMGADKIGRAHV